MSLFTLGSARVVLVVALVYSFSDVFNVIMALISPYTNQPFIVPNIKIHSFTSLTGVGALQGNFGTVTGVQLEIAKTPQCIYCYQMKP
jgi:hypothetical protein